MRIGNIPSPVTYSPQQVQSRQPAAATERTQGQSFGEQITSTVEKVNEMQKSADALAEQIASGNTEDTHKAMVAMERSLLALDFTLQVRNKMLEAYQEIMRTQV